MIYGDCFNWYAMRGLILVFSGFINVAALDMLHLCRIHFIFIRKCKIA